MSAINLAILPAIQEAIGSALAGGQDRVLGPELLVNGDFIDGATGWTVNGADGTHIVTFAGGTMRYQSGTTSPQLNVVQSGLLTVGKRYQLTMIVASQTSGGLKTDFSTSSTSLGTASGTYVYWLIAGSVNFNLTRTQANVDITIDKVSLREIVNA